MAIADAFSSTQQTATCDIAVADAEVRWALSPARFGTLVGIDTETNGLGPDAMAVGLSVGTNRPCHCGGGHYWSAYIPFGHVRTDLWTGEEPQADMRLVRELYLKLLDSIGPDQYVFFNTPFDRMVCRNTFGAAPDWHPAAPDVYHLGYLTDENLTSHRLKDLGARYFGEEAKDAERALEPHRRNQATMGDSEVPPSLEAPYAAGDVRLTLALRERLMPLIEDQGLTTVLDLETRLMPVIADMETRGVLVDADYMRQQQTEAEAEMRDLNDRWLSFVGRDVSLNSPDQLRKLLFDEWKLPVHRTTPKGEPSTDKFAMERLAAEGPEEYREALSWVREHAKLATLVETFFGPLPERADADGVVHTRYNQMVRTGRMSASRPNLQNMPARDHRVRRGFKVRPGKVWLLVDYSQIELRVLAWYSQSRLMREAYEQGQDLHQQTADLLNIERKVAKNVNFAQVYGAGIAQLARTAGTTEAEARSLKALYRRHYPEVGWFSKAAQGRAKQRGWVMTVSGRRRRFELGVDEKVAKYYRAANAIIQGSAADVMKLGMLRSWEAIQPLQKEGRAHLILTIHDELVFEVDAGLELDVLALVRPAMLSAFVPPISIPLDCDGAIARDCWGDEEELEVPNA